jgi:hypothetical protein
MHAQPVSVCSHKLLGFGGGVIRQLNAANMQIFLDRFAQAYADSFTILLLDNASAHTAKSLQIPTNVALLFQPPRCPELNPAERVWEAMRSKLAWQHFAHMDALEDELVALVHQYTPATLKTLAGYPYLLEAYHAACL